MQIFKQALLEVNFTKKIMLKMELLLLQLSIWGQEHSLNKISPRYLMLIKDD